MNLVAPVYPAASAYHAPVEAPYAFGVATVPLSELLATPGTRAVIVKEAPGLLAIEKVEQIRPYLSNFTLPELVAFFPLVDAATIARLDSALRALPASERPNHG